jgi:hypothetical protein
VDRGLQAASGGTYYMSSSAGSVFKSADLHFEGGDALAFKSQEAIEVRENLTNGKLLQRALLMHLLDPGYVRRVERKFSKK